MANTQGTVVHLYIPKTLAVLKSSPAFLIGNVSSQVDCFTVCIYGAYRTSVATEPPDLHCLTAVHRTESLQDRSPKVLGYFGTKGSTESCVKYDQASNDSWPTVWVRFDGDGTLNEVLLFKNSRNVSVSSVVVLEYDPYSLSRCLRAQTHSLEGIPASLVSSFNEVSYVPERTSGFCRLIPEQRLLLSLYDLDISKDCVISGLPDNIRSRSLGVEQMCYKFLLIAKLIRTNFTWVMAFNIITLFALDVFLGTVLTSYLRLLIPTYDDYAQFGKTVLELLLQLLTWLSGAPAGLKLNSELNTLFHSFYAYHLHLWEGYMDLVKPLLRLLCHAFVNLGFFGVTIQLAIGKDLLSLTTFHIYCLYIYATRLFYIEINTVKSLGRLIMGRKWNPLRERIDSVTLSVSELFLGAFGFTVALFLLPTICIYYVVFLALRLPIILIEFLIKFCIQLFDSLEIITGILIFTNSDCVGDGIYLRPIHSKPTTCCHSVLSYVHYEIKIQTTRRKFYRIPAIGESFAQILSNIVESKVIT